MSQYSEVLERLAALEAVFAEPSQTKREAGLLPDKLAAQRYKISVRTMERWDKISDFGFPPPVRIRNRRYREIAKLDQWDKDNARRITNPHNPHRDVAQALPRARAGRFTKPFEIR